MALPIIPLLVGLGAGIITYLATGKKGVSVNAAIDKAQEFIPDPKINAAIDAVQEIRENIVNKKEESDNVDTQKAAE